MSLEQRKYMYNIATVDGIEELDIMDSKIHDMALETIKTYMIGDITQYRPDLVSFIMYGSYNYGWLIAHHNGMLDSINEFTTGKTIKIPSMDSYYRYFNRYSRTA